MFSVSLIYLFTSLTVLVFMLKQHLVPLLKQNIRLFSAVAEASSLSVDKEELKRFAQLSNEWFDETGPFKALHSLNKLRVPWIVSNSPKASSSKLLDVGCGGGLLSLPLARIGYNVTGVDATPEAINAAKWTLSHPIVARGGVSDRLQYQLSTVENFAGLHENEYDVVVASEILEHVADLQSFVSACTSVVKPGGRLFFTTINKTLLSKIFAIWLAEDVLSIVPKGVHEWEKFVSPQELTDCLSSNGCSVRSINGFAYHPIGNHWTWTNSTLVNYALVAQKMK